MTDAQSPDSASDSAPRARAGTTPTRDDTRRRCRPRPARPATRPSTGASGPAPGDPAGDPRARAAARRTARPRRRRAATTPVAPAPGATIGRTLALALLLFVTVVLVLFVVFNTQTVDISLVFADVEAPLVLALLIAAVLGGLVVALLGAVLRAAAAQTADPLATARAHPAGACPGGAPLARCYRSVISLLPASRTSPSTGTEHGSPARMSHYTANLRDLEFNLFEFLDTKDRFGTGPFEQMDAETARGVLAEIRQLAEGPIAASFVDADRNPPVFDPATHSVTLPESFKKSVKAHRRRRVVPPRPARAPRRLRRPARADLGRLRDGARREPRRLHVRLGRRVRRRSSTSWAPRTRRSWPS